MVYRFGDCVLDPARRVLTRGGAEVAVEPKVFDLLMTLIDNAGAVVTKDMLVDEVWNGRIVSDSAITARIAAARRAVGDNGKAQSVIRTVARRGLEFVAPLETEGSTAAPSARDAPPAIRYTRSRTGQRLAYAVTGGGPGLPLVHVGPAMMTDLEMLWRDPSNNALFRTLGRGRRLLRYDPIGCGQSDRTDPSVDFQDIADDLKLVLDAAGIDKAAFMSFSGGAHTILRLAARYPERVDRLITVGGYVEGRDRRGAGPDPIRGLLQQAGDASNDTFTTAFLTAYFPEGPSDEVTYKTKMIQRTASAETRMRMRDAINTVSNLDVLPSIDCPALIIHARHDAVHPLSEAQRLAAGISGGELVVLETANHWPLQGNTVWEEYLRTVLAFLDR